MSTAISPVVVVAAQLCHLQNALQMLYHSARAVRGSPGRVPAQDIAGLHAMLERGAFETSQCEHMLSRISAANDEPASPAQA